MKVILLKDVRNVGRHSDVKEVADGFARNFLLPKKLACPATAEKIAELEASRARREAEIKKEEEQLDAKITALRGKTATVAARATEKGGLFKVVSAKEISVAIREQHSLEIPEAAVHFSEPVKTVGEHVIELCGKSAKVDFGVVVIPEQ